MDAVFIEFPLARRREAASLAAHYVAGVLDRPSMESGLIALGELAEFQLGDRVKTLRGSMSGTILRVLPDGRVVWRSDSGVELTTLPESLIREPRKQIAILNHDSSTKTGGQAEKVTGGAMGARLPGALLESARSLCSLSLFSSIFLVQFPTEA